MRHAVAKEDGREFATTNNHREDGHVDVEEEVLEEVEEVKPSRSNCKEVAVRSRQTSLKCVPRCE